MQINFKVNKYEELSPGSSVVMLYYGSGGSGKTWVGGACDLVISCGEGVETLLDKNYSNSTGNRPDIVFIREELDPKTGIFKKAEAFDKVTDVLDWVLTQPDITSVCIDDGTFFAMFAKNKSIESNFDNNKSKSLEAAKKAGYVSLNVQDYGEEIKIIIWFLATYVAAFKEKGKDLIILAHERHIMRPIDINRPMMGKEIARILPGFTGETFPDQIQAFFDLVWHSEGFVSNGKYYGKCRTRSDSTKLITKTRGSLFPENIINPDFKLIKKSMVTQTPYEELVKQLTTKK